MGQNPLWCTACESDAGNRGEFGVALRTSFKVSLRVFFSHACSLAEGSRCAEVASDGGTVCVDPLCCSRMRVAPKDSSGNDTIA